MIPHPAQYLLRFDDLCPTMNHARWRRFQALIEEFALCPILAIVPDNRDEELKLDAPDPEFWARMRAMEAAGATIGLHGYRHLCQNRGRSLVSLHARSEFAGAPEATQRLWIGEGLRILREHGLNPRVFVAPRHGFDHATLSALRNEGIRLISDGFARAPFVRGGLTWMPQQLWDPREKSRGLWTICVHSNSATEAQVSVISAFLRAHAAHFTSVDRVLSELFPAQLGLAEELRAASALGRIRLARLRKRWGGRA
ncbi:MAG: DUF2334 domain-containing protein [Terracidiphilus sp.]